MHLEIDNLVFDGNQVGIDFEYDEDFRKSVAKICGVPYISKKDLQKYIVYTMQSVIDFNKLMELRDQID